MRLNAEPTANPSSRNLPPVSRLPAAVAIALMLGAGAVFGAAAEVEGGGLTFDRYGGCRQIKGKATGFFHLEKNGKRWLFHTPEGNGIVLLGISGMHAQQASWNGALKDGSSHRDSCLRKFGAIEKWRRNTAERIRGWGFNYTGCFAYTTLKAEGVPYILTLSLTKYAIDHRGPVCGNIWYGVGRNYKCPDLWHPDLPEFMKQRFREIVGDAVDDPLMLYYYPDELDQLQGFAGYADHMGWAALVGREQVGSDPDEAAARRNKHAKLFANHTKIRFVKYLRERYDKVSQLNAAWGVDFKDFADVLKVRPDAAKWGGPRNPQRKGFPQYRQDLDGFVALIGRRYAQLVLEIVRAADRNHLIGFQIYGDEPNWSLMQGMREAGHFDFYMVNWDGKAYDRIGRPFMRLLYPSACNDSPLRFAGTCDRWQLCLDAKGEQPAPADYSSLKKTRLYLKIWDEAADYWFKLKFAGGRLPVYFRDVPVPRKSITEPWKYQVLYTGKDEQGASWFTVRSGNPHGCGRAWELKEGIEQLKSQGRKATYARSTAIPRSEFPSQAERGAWWALEIERIATATSPNGDSYLTGAEWWKYMDNGWTYWVEQVNWGLVTLKDNAYDGREATRRGADGKVGTWDDEVDDYGDCISPVRAANGSIYVRILREGGDK